MPNQLSLPFKRTNAIPIRQAVKEYITNTHFDVHPEAFKSDINQWEALRKDATNIVVHQDRVKTLTLYHAQLVFILTKLPANIGLHIPYMPLFHDCAPPVVLPNLAYERIGILFNLAALQSQLANAEDRSTGQGLKQAIAYYQNAAGTLNYAAAHAVPALRASLPQADYPRDLSEPVIRHFEFLMLAQAQECVWQRAKMDNKHAILAKLSQSVSSFYKSALEQLQESVSLKQLLPTGWLNHVRTKQLHFEAAAHKRKASDESQNGRYGHEVAHLMLARDLASQAVKTANQGGVASPVITDAKDLLSAVEGDLRLAARDNDLIYHKEVPSSSALPPMAEIAMVQSRVSKDLLEPKSALDNSEVIFGDLLSWGTKTAIDIYNERKDGWVTNEILDKARHLDDTADGSLKSLNLPMALDAVEQPIGLPPSLLKKAEEVRLENGPQQVETSIENVQKLSQRNMQIVNEAMDLLDQEAEEDEAFREETRTDRAPSTEVNKELVEKGERYRRILENAAESDRVVRQKWEEWENNISVLTLDEASLEASVPSSTLSSSTRNSNGRITLTRKYARALRVDLESLDELRRKRKELITRAQRLADADDITQRIIKAASGIERWVEVQPAMFEDILDEELLKYEKFRTALQDNERKQEDLLQSIKASEHNTLLLQSRKEDPIVKEREHALQSLDLSYHKYKEISRNLEEGLRFYNDFGNILTQFKETCRQWVNMRRHEVSTLSEAMKSMSLVAEPQAEIAAPPIHVQVEIPQQTEIAPAPSSDASKRTSTRSKKPAKQPIASGIPSLDSDAWEEVSFPLPTKAKSKQT
ncbi:pH-response regulator [Panus rudis PR-1116 ss-1]|nr:pH-response regulator [Panus rudis PR-1116 ss-1]